MICRVDVAFWLFTKRLILISIVNLLVNSIIRAYPTYRCARRRG